jgi:hypothetical protein
VRSAPSPAATIIPGAAGASSRQVELALELGHAGDVEVS